MDEPPEFHAINTGHTVELAMLSRPGGGLVCSLRLQVGRRV